MSVGRRAFALVSVALASACEGEVVTQVGDHLTYRHAVELEPCAGNLEYMDGYVPFVAGQLGLDVAAFDVFEYTWLEDREYQQRSPPKTGGYASGRRARALTPINVHELAHLAVNAEVSATHLGFVNEGLAVALEDLDHGGPRFRFEADPRPYFDDNRVDDGFAYYRVGGGLMAFLLGRWGPERALELHRHLGGGASVDDFEGAFAEVYGVSFADALAERERCPDDLVAAPLPYACAGPTIPWAAPGRWIHRRTLECASDLDVHGGRGGGADFAAVDVTVEVAAAGDYVLAVDGDPGVRAVLGACAPCPWLLEDHEVARGEALAVRLDAGLHAVKIVGPAEGLVLAGVSLVAAP